jgi:hypothetical protein
MASNESLGVYLNDHLAGSVAACDLIEQSKENNAGTPLGDFLEGLLKDIRADQQVLEGLMERLEVEKSTLKQAGSWVLEKMSRLKFKKAEGDSPGLAQLLELEALAVGVHGKRALWAALDQLVDLEPRLTGTDYQALMGRADTQLTLIEEHRLAAARSALAPGQS